MDLPKTEQELADLIDAKVQEATDQMKAKHNGEMANLRKKYDDELRKTKEQANLSAEEIAQQRIKEQQEAKDTELQELRLYKKTNEISVKLAKEGLPTYFKNDTRLLNADDGNVDKVIKDIKKEYEATLPKGANHSTVVNNANGQKPSGDSKQEVYNAVGDALKQALGK